MATRYGSKWRERVTIGYDNNGRVVERAIYGKTKAEVVRRRGQRARMLAMGWICVVTPSPWSP